MLERMLTEFITKIIHDEFEKFKDELVLILSNKPADIKADDVIIEDRLYTIKEASKLLKISTSKLYGDIYSGKLKAIKLGRSVRLRGKQLNEYVNKGENKKLY